MPPRSIDIARCPEHGLHGERKACYVCGASCEQVPMFPAAASPTSPIATWSKGAVSVYLDEDDDHPILCLDPSAATLLGMELMDAAKAARGNGV